jgi:DNA-binding GntR family transcriptional regulator
MEFMGLVRHEPNRGFFIEQITPQEVKEVCDFGQDLIFSRPQESAGLGHQAIFDAVVARDLSAARQSMRRHIRNIRNNALEGIKKRLAEAEQIDF